MAEAQAAANGGAYLLFLSLKRGIVVTPGRLGRRRLAPGRYVYVGSARRNLSQRVRRHQRLAADREGRRHWHVDALLLHPWVRLDRVELHPGGEECELSHDLARRAEVPIPGFGATDCRAGCAAHLYRLME